jgi:hypothetical protein
VNHGTSARIRRVHAADGPEWWCAGEFDPEPDRIIRIRQTEYPVHRCLTCGEELFIGYESDPALPSWDDVRSGRVP